MSLEKTPVTVVTGFLGAGKTTLIRHLLQNPQGRRLAVLVNEFGDVGVDGDLIRACADIVLLSKADLAGRDGLAAARGIIAAEAPRPLPMIPLTEGVIDPRVVLGINAAAEDDLAARPSHHDGEDEHDHDDFDTVVIDLPEQADPQTLAAKVARLAEAQKILRIKGHAAIQGKPLRLLVQAVGARVRHQFDRPWGDRPRRGCLVVIAEKGDIDADAIRAALA